VQCLALVAKLTDVVLTSTDPKPGFPPRESRARYRASTWGQASGAAQVPALSAEEIQHENELVPGAKPVARPRYRHSLPRRNCRKSSPFPVPVRAQHVLPVKLNAIKMTIAC
jgi:hypothetical protein